MIKKYNLFNFERLSFFSILISVIGGKVLASDDPDRTLKCNQEWQTTTNVRNFMALCDGAIHTEDGCKLNIERGCINGVEVDLLKNRITGYANEFYSDLSTYGFKSVSSNGVTRDLFKKEFLDRMYDPITLPSGSTFQFCSKIEGLSDDEIPGLSERKLNELSKGRVINYSSVAAFVNPTENIGMTSLHIDIEFNNGQETVRMSIRNANSLDKIKKVGLNSETENSSVVVAKSLHDAKFRLFEANLIRCKPDEILDPVPEEDSTVSRKLILHQTYNQISDRNPESRQYIADLYGSTLDSLAEAGLKRDELIENFRRMFGEDLKINLTKKDPVPPKEDSKKITRKMR